MKLIDFTNCKENKYRNYGGANGNKICIEYQNEYFMLKFPPVSKKTEEHNYTNSCISEYLGCKIIKSIGLHAQETLLGTYNLGGNEKIVVACKDFKEKSYSLQEFALIKNGQIETSQNGYGTELQEVEDAIASQSIYDSKDLSDFFWNMFIVDAFLGNFDRHNGNWGFLVNEETGDVKIAPIYDCGSCLYPQLTDEGINKIINNKEEMEARVYTFPNSALKINDQKINYYSFINSMKNTNCNEALLRIYPKIDLQEIDHIIDEVPCISDTRKRFYKFILKMRKELILQPAFDSLKN